MRRRTFLALRFIWAIYVNGLAIAVPSFLGALWLLQATAQGEGAVLVVTEGPKLLTPRIAQSGFLTYQLDVERRASCPGTWTGVFTSVPDENPITVTVSRPIQNTEIRLFDNARPSIQLPASVTPGRWKFSASVTSRCPTFSRIDPLATFDIEVTGP